MAPDHENKIDWSYLIKLIKRNAKQNKCTPIISNTIPFSTTWDHRSMVKAWADKIDYPLQNKSNLPRVAQFYRVTKDDEYDAKLNYLEFVQECLFQSVISQNNNNDPDIHKLIKEPPERAIPQIAKQDRDGYLKNPNHSLSILANLPFSVYLTTSYHTLIENALIHAGKEPRTGYYRWSEYLYVDENEKETLTTYEPTVEKPLVYHLHGVDSEPDSLVLTEDNYFDFFENIRRDVQDSEGIPNAVRDALSRSSLMLLGFELQEWDFRVLFRGLIQAVTEKNRPRSFSIQLSPQIDSEVENTEAIRRYLYDYFKGHKFEVYWGNAFDFTQELNAHWERK